ncbi:MAG TPA: hypothetical protein ENJ19_04015 [Gammaproteobacteria bacterium]|nr:hypothetical protein [Gammaproteobacteria bacterium]
MPAQLTLFAPGFFGPPGLPREGDWLAGLDLSATTAMLSRADRSAGGGGSFEAALCACFGLHSEDNADLPIAALTRQMDRGDAGQDYWLRADPVHLRADRDRLVMLGNSALALEPEERAQLNAELAPHFAELGMALELVRGGRAYLRLSRAAAVVTSPLSEVVGQDVLAHMPDGPDAASWRSLLNEAQMLLHASPVNRVRRQRGLPVVNSLWFWGGGRLPEGLTAAGDVLWGEQALAVALAQASGMHTQPLPAGLAEGLEQMEAGHHWLVWDRLSEAVSMGDMDAWRDGLNVLHHAWLAPAAEAVRRGRLQHFTLHTIHSIFSVTSRTQKRWWRRHRSLPALNAGNAFGPLSLREKGGVRVD